MRNSPGQARTRAPISAQQAYPGRSSSLVGQGDFGGVRVACLIVHPVRYVASEGRLSFVSRVAIELELLSGPRKPRFSIEGSLRGPEAA